MPRTSRQRHRPWRGSRVEGIGVETAIGMGHDIVSVRRPRSGSAFGCRPFEASRPSASHRQSPLRSLLPAPVPDQGPFARHYPASSLLRTSPPPRQARPCLTDDQFAGHASRPPNGASRVASALPCTCMPSPLPRQDRWVRVSFIFPQRRRPSPNLRRIGSCITLFEACSAFTARYGLHARQVPEGPSTLEASAASLPPRPFQLLPAGATVAGWESHPLRERAFHGH